MTKVEDFGTNLFTILANKLIHEENPDSSEEKLDFPEEKLDISEKKLDISEDKPDISENKPDISEKNFGSAEENLKYSDSNDDISRAVLMLSYAYRSAFRERFLEVLSILMRAEGNPMNYVRCFAEASYEKYSSLKFLIVCSFISEIFLFLSTPLVLKKKHRYVQQTTEALKDVFQCIFEKNFPQNGWTDIQNEASKIAKGFQFLETFMNNETSNITASQVADAIITDNYESENKHQQTDVVMAGTPSDEMVSVISSVLNSQVLVHLPVSEVPILFPDGLPPNQTAYLAHSENLIYTPVFPISFGTVDEDAQLSYLLHSSGDQTEAVIFLDQPSGTEPNFQKVVKTAEASNIESRAPENLTARSSEDEPEPSFRTVKLTESGASKICVNAILFGQELMDGHEQLWKGAFLSPGFKDELGPSFQTVKKIENLEIESCIADNADISEQELIDGDEQFGKNNLYLSLKIEPTGDTIERCSQGFKQNHNVCKSETLAKENDPESETFSKENVNEPESGTFSKEESINDPESETFSIEENVNDPDNETFLREENVNDSDSETFSKEENTSASGNAVNVPENHSEIF